jgi:alpha-D-xyloside xylohydrolase
LSSLRGGLSLGLSGFTFWSQDTGGFVGVPSDEVYTRWTQLSIFQSHLRFHGCPPNYKEPWNFSPETQRIVRDYLNLRYRLIPYLYTEAQVAAREGLPILRHLVIDFQDDPTVYNIEDQYMCGRHILVAPILTKNNHRSIYLPDGCWYDFWTGERLNGKQWIDREVDLETIPVYIRGGIALPLAKLSQSTDDLSNDGMTVRLYPNEEGQAAYTLMELDDRIVVNVRVKRRNAEVELNPELSNVLLQIPNSVGISEVKLNSKKTKWSTI